MEAFLRRHLVLAIVIGGLMAVVMWNRALSSMANSIDAGVGAIAPPGWTSAPNLPAGSAVTLDGDTVADLRTVEHFGASARRQAGNVVYKGRWTATGRQKVAGRSLVAVARPPRDPRDPVAIRLVGAETMPRTPSPSGLQLYPGPVVLPLYIEK